MVWDLAWWGNSSDGNKVGIVCSVFPPPYSTVPRLDNGGLRKVDTRDYRFSFSVTTALSLAKTGS